MEVLEQGRTSMKVRVERADEPFWVVLGQSDNAGWKAEANGVDLGDSQLVDGYANGWLVEPSDDGPTTIWISWEPQRVVRLGVWVSLFAVLLCLGIVAVALVRRRRRGERAGTGAVDEPELADPTVAGGRTPRPAVVAATAIVTGAVAAAIVRPWVGLVVGALVLLVLLVPRARSLLTLVPPFLLGAVGLFIAWAQFRHDYPPQFEWPTGFWRVRNAGWLAILLIAADVVVGLVRKGEGDSPASTAPPDATAAD